MGPEKADTTECSKVDGASSGAVRRSGDRFRASRAFISWVMSCINRCESRSLVTASHNSCQLRVCTLIVAELLCKHQKEKSTCEFRCSPYCHANDLPISQWYGNQGVSVTRRLPDRAALAGASNFVVPRSTRKSPHIVL